MPSGFTIRLRGRAVTMPLFQEHFRRRGQKTVPCTRHQRATHAAGPNSLAAGARAEQEQPRIAGQQRHLESRHQWRVIHRRRHNATAAIHLLQRSTMRQGEARESRMV